MRQLSGTRTYLHVCRGFLSIAAIELCLFISAGARAQTVPVATTTTLAASSTSLNQGTTLTLIATVSDADGHPVTAGAVKFCVASATRCDGLALLGRVQLISTGSEAGKAILKIRPGAGSHGIRASFAGTSAALTSSSEPQTITVNAAGADSTRTTFSQSWTPGDNTLTATVSAGGTTLPTGSVRFLDTTNSDYVLGTVKIDASGIQHGFGSPQSFPVGENPLWVQTGDFNEDGIPDFVVANMTTTDLSVMLGDGSGGFTAAPGSPIHVASRPKSIAVGDFNSDGHLDLVVAHDSDDCVMLLLGDGSGQFSQAAGSPYSLVAGRGGETVVAADFNNDGNLDWAVIGFSGYIDLALGDGAGGFTMLPAAAYASVGGEGLEVGDFNKDGVPDLLATNRIDNLVRMFLGDGMGGFTLSSGSPYSLGETREGAAVTGDFNGDGSDDFAVLLSNDRKVAVMLADGAGGFTPATNLPSSIDIYPRSIRVADFNGDGIADLVVAGCYMTVLIGDGHGGFTASSPFTDTGSTDLEWLALADFDGDGATDAITASFWKNSAILLRGQVTGTAVLEHVSIPGWTSHLVLAEYSGDDNHLSSRSEAAIVGCTPVTTAVTLSASPASWVSYRQPLTLEAAISPATAMNYQAGGYVRFEDGGAVLCAAVAVDGTGKASCTTETLSIGGHNFTASYSGDDAFDASNSQPLAYTVTPVPTAVTLSTTPASSTNYGKSVTLEAVITPSHVGDYQAGGTVTFMDGNAALCTGIAVDAAGKATCKPGPLSLGSHNFTASYTGDAAFTPALSQPLTFTVNTAAITITAPDSTLTLKSGKQGTVQLTIGAAGTVSGDVTFACSGLPSGASCAFSPATVKATSLPATVSVTINTVLPFGSSLPGTIMLSGLLLPFGTLWMGRRRGLRALLAAVAVVLILSLAACGAKEVTRTPAGTYDVVVTATASGSTQGRTIIKLNVR